MLSLQLHKYSWKILFVVLGVTFSLLPSVFSSRLIDSTQTAKFLFLYYAITVAVCFLVLFLISSGKAISLSISPLDILLSILLTYIIINRYYLHSVQEFSLRFLELLLLAVLYVVLRVFTFSTYLYFLMCILFGGLLQLTVGFLQLLGMANSHNTNFVVTGNFFNPGGYAGYLSIVTVVSFGLYINRSHRFFQNKYNGLLYHLVRYLPLATLIGCAMMLPSLRSRSAWISALAGLAFIWAVRHKRIKFDKRIRSLTARYLSAFVALILCTAFLLYNFKKHSAQGRVFIYHTTINIIKASPYFGVGFDRFRAHYMKEQANWFEQNGYDITNEAQLADDTFYAFNELLQFASENGLFGVLLAISVITFYLIYHAIPRGNLFCHIAIGILITYCVFSLFTYSSDNLSIKYLVTFALSLLCQCEKRALFCLPISLNKKTAVICASIVVFSTFITIHEAEQVRKSFLLWGKAQDLYQKRLYTKSNIHFNAAYTQFRTSGDFLMQYAKSLSMVDSCAQALPIFKRARIYLASSVLETSIGDCEKKLGNYVEAERAYKTAMHMVPNRFYPLYLLMRLYADSGQTSKALHIAKKINQKQIKIPSPAIDEIKATAHHLIE